MVAGLAYEFIKYAGKNDDKKWVCVLSKPGLWMQHITTREPTDDIIEVGIVALNGALYGVEETSETVVEETEEDYTDVIRTDIRVNDEPKFFKDEPVSAKKESLDSSFDDILKEIEKFAPKYNPSPEKFEDELQLMEYDNED